VFIRGSARADPPRRIVP